MPISTYSPPAAKQSPQSISKRYPAISSLIEGEEVIMLRELSGNEGTPPSNPPLNKKAIKRGRKTISPGEIRYDVSRYIEHLENQLAIFQQSMTSPRTGRPIHKKVRSFSQENKRLRETVDEWEDRFDLRVKEAIEHQASTESDLRRKIKTLEDEISLRDSTIRDLRYSNDRTLKDLGNLESLRLSIERLENSKDAVEATNRSLEKRNDVLTELLAQSPTRSCHSLDNPSVSTNSNAWSTPRPRPRSMMPRLPSSPHSPLTWRPLSVQVSPITASELSLLDEPPSRYFGPASPVSDDRHHGDQVCHPTYFRNPRSFAVRSESSQSASQRSSIISQSLDDVSVTDLPLPLPSPEGKTERANRNRRSRRFAPGSTSLKPLLLPTLQDNSSTTSSPTQQRPFQASQASNESMDSIAAMVSSSVSYETPTQPRRHSSKEVDLQTLRALEGASEGHFNTFEEVLELDECAQSDISRSRSYRFSSDDAIDTSDLIPRSLAFAKPGRHEIGFNSISHSTQASNESNRTELQNPWELNEEMPARDQCDDFRPHATLRPTSSLSLGLGPESQGHEPTKKQRPPIPRGMPYRYKREKLNFDYSPSNPLQSTHPPLSPSEKARNRPEETQQCRPSGANALTFIPSVCTFGLTTRTIFYYRQYLRALCNNPTGIACHVLVSTWRHCWRPLGRFSWWILGLFLGSRAGGNRQKDTKTDCPSAAVRNNAAKGSVDETGSKGYDGSSTNQRGLKTESPPIDRPGEAPVRGWRRSIYLWGRFSFAIALAIGGALVKGPEEMLKSCDHHAELVSEGDGGTQDPSDARREAPSDGALRHKSRDIIELECSSDARVNRLPASDHLTCSVADSPNSPWDCGRAQEATKDVVRGFSRNAITSTPTKRPSTAPESLDCHNHHDGLQGPRLEMLGWSNVRDRNDDVEGQEGLGRHELELGLDTPTKSGTTTTMTTTMNTTRKRRRREEWDQGRMRF